MDIKQITGMNLDQMGFFVAGIIILLSVILYAVSGPIWLIFPVLLAIDLIQAPFTNFCALAMLLKKFGYTPGTAFN